MQINFYPEYDNPEFEKAAKEYAKIWKEEGNKIVEVIEKISGLKFKEKIINAIAYKYGSWSYPLRLQSNLSLKLKKCSVVHELCHRLMKGNHLQPEKYTIENTHKQIDLILFDIFCELYGEEIARDRIRFEISRWDGKGVNPYRIAWDWALSMTKEERQELWKSSLKE